jgi:hypothetical protein
VGKEKERINDECFSKVDFLRKEKIFVASYPK